MSEASVMKTTFEELSRKIRDTVKATEAIEVHQPETVTDVYQLMLGTESFLRESSSPLYEELYPMTNLLEDHIRSVYLFMDDATLEGHATELESHLAQLRMCGDDIRSTAKTFNDEFGGIISTYMTNLKLTWEAEGLMAKLKGTTEGEEKADSPANHIQTMERVFINQCFHLVMETLRDYKEACIKLLSIMAIALGRWENKLEDRVDAEHFTQGMIMSNIQAGGSISTKSKKGKKRQANDSLYM